MITISVANADKIRRDLEQYPRRAVQVYGKAVQDASAVYRDIVKTMPPVSAKTTGYGVKGIPKDSGRLRGSIRKKRLQRLAAGIGPDVKEYDVYVHEGTSKMPARPFMDWGLELGGQDAIDAIFIAASAKVF